MKAKEIRELSNHAISPLEDSSKLKKARKDIARMLTILSEMENQDKK